MKHKTLNKVWTIKEMWEMSKNADGADINLHYHNIETKEIAIELAELASEVIGIDYEEDKGGQFKWYFVKDGNFKVTFFVKRQQNVRELNEVLEEVK